jgi:hypothetical protein
MTDKPEIGRPEAFNVKRTSGSFNSIEHLRNTLALAKYIQITRLLLYAGAVTGDRILIAPMMSSCPGPVGLMANLGSAGAQSDPEDFRA